MLLLYEIYDSLSNFFQNFDRHENMIPIQILKVKLVEALVFRH